MKTEKPLITTKKNVSAASRKPNRTQQNFAKCDMCNKKIAACDSHYVVEKLNGAELVWCYSCAESAEAHHLLAPTCIYGDDCDIWWPHPTYWLTIFWTRAAYRAYLKHQASRTVSSYGGAFFDG